MNRTGILGAAAAALLLLVHLGPAPAVLAQDGGGAPPAPPPAPQDLRFFPKELEDALKELADPAGDEEVRYDALKRIARMTILEGATEPLRKDAFEPVLQRVLEPSSDTFADGAAWFLETIDRERLATELKKAAASEKDPGKLRAMTFLAEGLGPAGVEVLTGPMASHSSKDVRVRVLEALGLLRAKEGVPLALAQVRDPDAEIRNSAALALGRIGDPRAVPALLSGLDDNKGFHGWFCADALGRIEEPGLFDGVLARAAGSGASGPAAAAVEACARAPQAEALLGMVQKSPSAQIRVAAANALGRIVGDSREAEFKPEFRTAVAEGLLEGICSDREATVRAACLFALRRCAVESTGAAALKRLTTVKGDDRVLFLITILGERRVKEAAVALLRSGILGAKEPMIRRASGVAFWQISDPEAIREFREKIENAAGFDNIQRLCGALGSWKTKEGFELALKMLRTTREGSREQNEVLLALEKMTGHWFGPYPGIWNKWFTQNPQFFTSKQSKIERDRWREEFDKENKGFRQTKETERSVQSGLSWLARHQGHDGVWDATAFAQRCDPRNPCSRSAGSRLTFSQAGISGLTCLAFTGAGYNPHVMWTRRVATGEEGAGAASTGFPGKHRHTIMRGVDALLATMTVDGDYDQADRLWNRSYARPICMQALAEAYAASGEERYRRGAERILAREFSLMNQRGGWRYSLHREVGELDSSVTAWVVFALKAAEKAGIPVPALLWEGPYLAFDFLSERVPAKPEFFELLIEDAGAYGTEVGVGTTYVFQTGYQDPSGAGGRATTPLGLMSRIFLGWRRTHPFCIGSANYIVKTYQGEFDVFGEPGKEDWSRAGRFTPKAIWPMYCFYYSTLAMHQMGGRYFRNWNERVSRVLPQFQKKTGCERGAWPGPWQQDGVEGWIYTTCMGVLTLETYYRYAPVLSD